MSEAVLDLDPSLGPAISTPLHVLIVEDDQFMAEWVRRHIEPLREAFPRATIQVVNNWLSAHDAIAADPPPSVTLLDLSLPDSSMHETIAKVAIIEKRSAVVIITGHKVEDVEALLVESKVEVLHKSPGLFGPGNIIRAIVRALERRTLADENQRLDGLRGIVAALKAKGYGTPESTPA